MSETTPGETPVERRLRETMTRDAMIEKLTNVRMFIEYARYELEPVLVSGAQFPSQACADKRLALIDEMLAALRSSPEPQKTTPEQEARDMLERMGYDDAQSRTAGDVIELANLIADARSRPALPDDPERKHRVPDDVMVLARAGKLIDAIKLLRHDFGLPLKEAKLLIEDAMRIEAIRATAAAYYSDNRDPDDGCIKGYTPTEPTR